MNETIADIKDYFASWDQPVYGIALGDIVSDKPVLLSQMKALLGTSGITLLLQSVITTR